MNFFKRIVNKILIRYEINIFNTDQKIVYLTFDDGPEPIITEFVLDELDKYGFKATFFCRGDNAERNPELLMMIRKRGNSIGNHTYSHLHAYETSTATYLEDVKHADQILQTNIFRPPHGSLTFRTWWRLRNRKIVFWAINSEDSDLKKFNFDHALCNLKANTRPGDVVLFHFCNRHENETKQILPAYLKWLSDNGYKADLIN